MSGLAESFCDGIGPHWRRGATGDSSLELTGHSLRLVNQDTSTGRYSNAQIDDYRGLARREFRWSPSLTLTVRARFSHPGPRLTAGCDCDFRYQPDAGGGPILSGTAGFGFWNAPFGPPGAAGETADSSLLARPRALWFFYASPPSNMKLDIATPGCGWKAATIDAGRWPFLFLAPAAPLALPLMRLRPLYRRLWPVAQRAMGVREVSIAIAMTGWHDYVIQWERQQSRFLIDGQVVLDCAPSPRGPLGLVIWLDNQYMIVTPQGRFGHGLLAQPGRQWLELAAVTITH